MAELACTAIRVQVKKCEGLVPPEWRKFSVDPQLTSLEVLYSILAKAFDLRNDFTIRVWQSNLAEGLQDSYQSILSDYDLDEAFFRSIDSSSEPCLNLRIDIKPLTGRGNVETNYGHITSNVHDIQKKPLLHSQHSTAIGRTLSGPKHLQSMQVRLPGLFLNQMEKTISLVTRALHLVEDQTAPVQSRLYPPARPPLSDAEFRTFLDSVGQIVRPQQLRRVIYAGGIDPSLRRVVWKHILNVYPEGMTGRARMDYIKRMSMEYYRLRENWRTAIQHSAQSPTTDECSDESAATSDLSYVTSMVRKDVLRTDRLHPFYSGPDDNQNIAALFNVLTTYALNHPSVSYCQGMSDIASPLLVTMCDEAQAYICFCAIMRRLRENFRLDGVAMTLKFQHLSKALQYYDPELADYLHEQQADDLLFCYRWLLLEMKREFAFEDSMRMLEVLWSALPAVSHNEDLVLAEREFVSPAKARYLQNNLTKTHNNIANTEFITDSLLETQTKESAYNKMYSLRRQSSGQSLKRFSRFACTGNERPRLHATNMQEGEPNHVNKFTSRSFSINDDAMLSTDAHSLVTRSIGGHFKDLKERIVTEKKHTYNIVPPTNKPAIMKSSSMENNANGYQHQTTTTDHLSHREQDNCNSLAEKSILRTNQSYSLTSLNVYPMNTNSREIHKDLENLDCEISQSLPIDKSRNKLQTNPFLMDDDEIRYTELLTFPRLSDSTTALAIGNKGSSAPANSDVFVWENPLHCLSPQNSTNPLSTDDQQHVVIEKICNAERKDKPISKKKHIEKVDSATDRWQTLDNKKNIRDENPIELKQSSNAVLPLPPPHEFGGGNPFLMFLCVTLLMQHRQYVIRAGMDYNEIAMHFDKMVRKHNVTRVLSQARLMYGDYLIAHEQLNPVCAGDQVNTNVSSAKSSCITSELPTKVDREQ